MINVHPQTDVAPTEAAAPAQRGIGLRVEGLLPASAYRRLRQTHRQRLIAYRRARTVVLGPCMRLQFEDLLTLRYQIQEVLCAERIEGGPALQQEIDTYAHLLPDAGQWKATLLIELPDAAERERALPSISLAAHRVYVEVGSLRTTALANEDLADGRNARHLERPSGVHFLRFALSEAMRGALRDGAAATLGCDSEHYPWRQPIPAAVLWQLRADLTPLPAALGATASGWAP